MYFEVKVHEVTNEGHKSPWNGSAFVLIYTLIIQVGFEAFRSLALSCILDCAVWAVSGEIP